MALKLTSGYPCKVSFKFYDEEGNLLINLINPTATLYSSLTGEVVYSNLALELSLDTNSFELIFTPDSNLSGTYYFIAQGVDIYGILRKTSLFVDIIPITGNYLLIGYEQAIKFINDTTIDYSILPALIQTALEWVQDLLGKNIFPQRIQESLSIISNFIYTSKYPILEIKEIKTLPDNQILSTDNYIIYNANSGIIKLLIKDKQSNRIITDFYNYSEILIDYIAGYNPIPETIYTAIGMVVGYLYDRAKYQNFDRIKMIGVEGYISKDTLQKIKEILSPFIKRI